ncbi:hypothetical protein FHR90_003366 [Endobacter medicaginis]|uniref:Tetracyclin repressor-like C-terminal domain-containing protein n=1 Tax=Endobacter medicaginis TaxID=1181271 RepID=A0A839V4N1_9PROT|nr:hypothetical protein [Endobacter medicaginis]MBB3175510.1 hypothetical protein [Endobacter medicaginis]MCX5477154.1 hypothetical protein [Endobacter medicaginis]
MAEFQGVTSPAMAEVAEIAADEHMSLKTGLRDVIACVVAFYVKHPEARDFVTRHAADSSERALFVADRLLKPAYATCRALFAAGIEAGLIRSKHPALFFALLNSAASQPAGFPALLNRLAPEIQREAARALMTDTIVATLLHEPAQTAS